MTTTPDYVVRERTVYLSGTQEQIDYSLAPIRAAGRLVAVGRMRYLDAHRLAVPVTLRVAERAPFLARHRRAVLVSVVSLFPIAGVGGFALGTTGAVAALAQLLLGALGMVMAIAFLGYAVTKISHARHCPGCADH